MTSTKNKKQQVEFINDFEQVQQAELNWIKRRRSAVDQSEAGPLVGLALSGGGIRSATFNLGLLQALSRKKTLPQIDIISSVSGGGYIASCFSWIRNHINPEKYQEFSDTPIDKPAEMANEIGGNETVLDWLRGHGKYLIAGKGFSYWQLVASIIAGTLLNLIVLIPLFLWMVSLASSEWLPLNWPEMFRYSDATFLEKHDGFLLIFYLGLICILGYLVTVISFALTGIIPYFRKLSETYFFRRTMGQFLAFGVTALLIGVLPFFAGVETWVAVNIQTENAAKISRHLTFLLPLTAGLLTLYQSRSVGNTKKPSNIKASIGLSLLLYSFFVLLYHLVNHTDLIASQAFWIWSILSVLLAFTANVNTISMHSYYRSRLALTYMPVIQDESGQRCNADDAMNFRLNQMSAQYGAPLPLINTTLNTTSSKKQKLSSREGDSFCLTPLYCGSTYTGYRSTDSFESGEMALSTAFSISGAAVDPNTYATSLRPVAFLMALFNFRLGYWSNNPNPQRTGNATRKASWYRLMLREMLGRGLSETCPQIHLSDGGHFENLGIYELLRRRCRYIIASDAGADPNNTMSDLGKLIQRARADFGVDIEIDITTLGATTDAGKNRPWRLGKIRYKDGSQGELLYIKALIQPVLSADIYAYWRNNSTFPDQSTADQFFDEWQFDSYRELGVQITNQIITKFDSIESMFKGLHDND